MNSHQSRNVDRRRFGAQPGRPGASGWLASGRRSASRFSGSRRRSLSLEWLDSRILLTTSLVSGDLFGNAAGGPLFSNPITSRDGRYVVFESSSNNLVSNDSNNLPDVFVRDQVLGTTQLVSVNAGGTASGNGTSGSSLVSNRPYSINDDGRYVAFVSDASDLIAGDTNNAPDVFVRDLTLGTTSLVSVNSQGSGPGVGGAFEPMISGNGTVVVFQGNSDDYTTNDDNGLTDVFARDLIQGTTTLVSVDTGSPPGNSGDGPSTAPSVSIDGRYVAFQSLADNLVINDFNGVSDVFVRDLTLQTTSVVSSGTGSSSTANGPSFGPIISGNGTSVAYISLATDLVSGITDSNNTRDVFVNWLASGSNFLASVDTTGLQAADGLSGGNTGADLSLSDDGLTVAYASDADNIVNNDFNSNRDVFAYKLDLSTITPQVTGGQNVLVSIDSFGNSSGSGESYNPSISGDGQFVGFVSQAGNLVSNDFNNATDVFVRDLTANTTTLASYESSGLFSGNGASGSTSMVAGNSYLSANGRFATFSSVASNLVDNDFNNASDIFLANLAGQFVFNTSNFFSVEGDGTATITVDRIGGSQGAATVDYSTSDGTAQVDLDYLAAAGTLVFAPGETSQTFTITLLDDSLIEGDETVNLALMNPTGGVILDNPTTSILIIQDDDSIFSFGSPTYVVVEGSMVAQILVTRTGSSIGTDTVDYSTSDGTAVAGQDYIAASGTLTFSDGETQQFLFVTLINDTVIEPDETFGLTLSNPSTSASIGTPSSTTVTITDDDSLLSFSAPTYTTVEGSKGILIVVNRVGAALDTVSVEYSTGGGTATSGIDFIPASGTLVFESGVTSQTFFLTILDDSKVEGTESFNVTLSNPIGNAALGTPSDSRVDILDDDSILNFSAPTYNVRENDGVAVFTVNRIGDLSTVATVDYATIDGSAFAGSDYQATSGTLTFGPGVASLDVPVTLINDPFFEATETFNLILTNPVGSVQFGVTNQSTMIITDEDPLSPLIFGDDVSVFEGDQPTTVVNLVYRLDAPADFSVTFNVTTVDGTAIAGEDYLPYTGTVLFSPGQTVQTVPITLIGDLTIEPDKFFLVQASNADGGRIVHPDLRVTILNDDSTVVTNTNDSGNGSLRKAILVANQAPGSTITFAIPSTFVDSSTGVITISPATALPTIVNPTIVDGNSQSRFFGQVQPRIIVQIDGHFSIPSEGLVFGADSDGSVLQGLSIFGFVGNQVRFESDNAGIFNNFIGIAAGTPGDRPTIEALANPSGNPGSDGLLIHGSNATVGGASASSRNVISGNKGQGIEFAGAGATGGRVLGNYVGLDPTGSFAVPNLLHGIVINVGAGFNVIGPGNVVSGNLGVGIELVNTVHNVIAGNFIGTDAAGTRPLGNGGGGICLDGASFNMVGGFNLASTNLISGNAGHGILVRYGATGNRVAGNRIGSDASGLRPLPNLVSGILVDGSSDNTIGGSVAGATNLISGNGSVGVILQGGATRNFIGANLIGSDLRGTSALGNGNAGILVEDSPNNIIGPGNLVSGNGTVKVPGAGIWIEGAGSVGNRVIGNRVGTNLTGSAALPNTSVGILVNEAPLNRIGGSNPGEGNLVSGNIATGLMLSGIGAHGNAVQGNLIGTDASGTRRLGNGTSTIGVGLYLLNAPGNFIGGTSLADGNLISGNNFDGVELFGPFATRNLIQSNRIGTDASGSAALGNGKDGVVFDQAPNNRIIGNFISANARNGVFLSGSTGNLLQSNAIGLGVAGQPLGNGGFGVVIANGSTGTILIANTNVNNKLGPLRNTDQVPITVSPSVNSQKAKPSQTKSSRKNVVKIQAKSHSFANRSIAKLQTSGRSKSKA
ncbi:Calx-beta domain-containing protein [Tundrisphaera lichenicola]|uniref:beta strand repeat-containing protein n=1 Tax=Tundrisphaera lichenicola TaxID=2029860 RepID=UPI003EBD7062